MKYEKEYIDYLIKNKGIKEISILLEDYLLEKINFELLIEKTNSITSIYSYKSFAKSNQIDDLLDPTATMP